DVRAAAGRVVPALPAVGALLQDERCLVDVVGVLRVDVDAPEPPAVDVEAVLRIGRRLTGRPGQPAVLGHVEAAVDAAGARDVAVDGAVGRHRDADAAGVGPRP